jgi:DNA-binding MarR family transcriptional regulator
MHKLDIKVLQELYKNKCINDIQSFSINQILKSIELSYSTIHNILNSLVVAGYAQKGFKNSRADTYYITEKGIEKLRRLLQ